jgi:hypothetical protein
MRVKFISLQCLCTQIYDNLGAILSVQYHIWDIKICNLSSIDQISFLCLSWICTPYTWFATYISIVALLIPNLLSLVVYGHGSNLFYYTLYVNDIVLTISTLSLLTISTLSLLQQSFSWRILAPSIMLAVWTICFFHNIVICLRS